MRILYILNTLAVGGAERHTLALAERMRARGHEVLVLALREPGAGQCETTVQISHLNIRKSASSALAGYLNAMRMLRAFRPDLLNSHNFHGNIFARLLRLANPSIPVISTFHNVYEGGRLRRLAYRLTNPLAFHSVAVSNSVAEEHIRQGVIAGSNCTVIPNGIDPEEFSPRASRRSEMRRLAGADDDFVWLAVGRLARAKDYPNLLRAFAVLQSQFPGATLRIAGEGKSDLRDELSALCAELQIDAKVHWLGLSRDIPALLDAADGFVLASAWEGMPLAIAEAMAMEKPIVATDVGGVSELLGECGLQVPAGNTTELADAMKEVMQMTGEQRRNLGRMARARVQKRFDIEAGASSWEALYLATIRNG